MNIKYKIFKTLLLCLPLMLLTTSCDKDFGDLNTNPNTSDNLDTKFLLNFVINRSGSSRYENWRGNLIYCSQWAQQLSGTWGPNDYNTTNEDWLSAYWNDTFGTYMRNLQDIINREEGTNIEAMAMIMKVLYMQRITDMYGDIPYSEAFQGGDFAQPSYDRQEEVYNFFIADLKQAVSQLNGRNGDDPGNFDPIFGGDIEKWRKFGNTLMLRVGMRLSEVNSGLAQSTVSEAISGGIISSQDEIAWIAFDGSNPDGPVANGIGEVFQDFGIGGSGFNLSDEYLGRLQEANDPRESIIAVTYNSDGTVNTDVGPGEHIGRVNGRDYESIFGQAMPNHTTMVAYNSPIIFMSWAEAEFLRAEAIQRGWASGDVQEAYETGVSAACKQLALYPETTEISDDQISQLLSEPSVAWVGDNALNLINTQKWIALLLDGFEAYANYRRIGFPELTPGETSGESDGTIPKRLRYPASEALTNKDNYDAAISAQGADAITTRLWWDVN